MLRHTQHLRFTVPFECRAFKMMERDEKGLYGMI